jgi:hypothetical protein
LKRAALSITSKKPIARTYIQVSKEAKHGMLVHEGRHTNDSPMMVLMPAILRWGARKLLVRQICSRPMMRFSSQMLDGAYRRKRSRDLVLDVGVLSCEVLRSAEAGVLPEQQTR